MQTRTLLKTVLASLAFAACAAKAEPFPKPRLKPFPEFSRARALTAGPVRLADNKVKGVGDFFVPEPYRDIYCRCDLHPRWRPDGRQLGFNSVHEGSRQVYVMDVVKSPPSWQPCVNGAPLK